MYITKAFRLRPNITWGNSNKLAIGHYQKFGLRLPPQLPKKHVKIPKFVSTLGTGGKKQGNVHGEVSISVKVKFEDFGKQWKPIKNTGPNYQWVFTGGDIIVNVMQDLSILNSYNPIHSKGFSNRDKTLWEYRYMTIYSHEILHVLDNYNILTSWLSQHISSDKDVKNYVLLKKKLKHGLKGEPLSKVLKSLKFYLDGLLCKAIENIYILEHNSRNSNRDSKREYNIVKKRLEKIETIMSNRTFKFNPNQLPPHQKV